MSTGSYLRSKIRRDGGSIPLYVSADRATAFVRSFLAFSHGKVVSDNPHAPGVEIGRTSATYRRIRISSVFGAMAVFATTGIFLTRMAAR